MADGKPPQKVRELDDVFLQVLAAMKAEVTTVAGQASQMILQRASTYVASSARQALVNFHQLYTTGAEAQAGTLSVNRNVDDIFDQVAAQVEDGVEESNIVIMEEEAAARARLSFSGVQKELEAIIRMDAGIREKLVPILSNMQFEDSLRQRLDHIEQAWSLTIDQLQNPEAMDLEVMTLEIAQMTTSVAERASAYRILMRSEPPPDADVADMVLFDL